MCIRDSPSTDPFHSTNGKLKAINKPQVFCSHWEDSGFKRRLKFHRARNFNCFELRFCLAQCTLVSTSVSLLFKPLGGRKRVSFNTDEFSFNICNCFFLCVSDLYEMRRSKFVYFLGRSEHEVDSKKFLSISIQHVISVSYTHLTLPTKLEV